MTIKKQIIANPLNTKGRNTFHVNLIRRSYRIRGKVPRAQINTLPIKTILIAVNKSSRRRPKELVNTETVIIDIARILVYSAIKINAKGPLLYSVLKPETNSDSPSAKSKGVRLVSANIVIKKKKISNI